VKRWYPKRLYPTRQKTFESFLKALYVVRRKITKDSRRLKKTVQMVEEGSIKEESDIENEQKR
jgi:hypothetical protein